MSSMHSFKMKVLLPARVLPDGALVTKRTGTARFRIRRRMRFYTGGGADESQRQTITPLDDCVILVSVNDGDRGNDAVNIYPGTTEFMWLVDSNELENWLREQETTARKEGLLKVLLPAMHIPSEALVTRHFSGKKEYRLHRGLQFFSTNEETGKLGNYNRTITAKHGCVFLVDGVQVDVYPATTEVFWLVNSNNLEDWLRDCHEPTCK